MKRILACAAAVLVVVVLIGCSYVRTGDPGCMPPEQAALNRDAFDCVTPGMTRGEVGTMLCKPMDTCGTWMHWQVGTWGDAWVFFDDNGTRVTGKYWQDEDTLRLTDVPPYGD